LRKGTLAVGSFYTAIGVICGAFGAHYLKERLPEAALESWKTASQYQLILSIGLIIMGMFFSSQSNLKDKIAVWMLGTGILFFSGSIYLLTLFHWKFLGPVTPLGGLLIISSWILFGISRIISSKENSTNN
jgi:uncharacterized membrane protein YgdD (TMEM256/DUF423 family)